MKTLKACWFPLLMFVMALCVAKVSHAGDATLTWSIPTARTDGTPMPVGEIAGYTIGVGAASQTYTQESSIEGGAVTSDTITGLGPGTVYFAIRTRTTDGLQSVWSGEVSKTFEEEPPVIPPDPPGGLTVQEQARAVYTLVQTADRMVLVPVGTVPAGTPCDGTQAIRDANGLTGYVVPKLAVVWAGTVRSEVVVAECQ